MNSTVRAAKVPTASILARERARPSGSDETQYTDCFKVKLSPRCANLPPGTIAACLFGSVPLGSIEIPLLSRLQGGSVACHAEFYTSDDVLHSRLPGFQKDGGPTHDDHPDGSINEYFYNRFKFSDAIALGLVDLRSITEFHLAEARSCGDVLVYARRAADGTLSGRGNLTASNQGAPAPEPAAKGILDEVCFRSGEQLPFTTSTWAAVRQVPPYSPPGTNPSPDASAITSSGEREVELMFGSHARMRGPVVPKTIPGSDLLEKGLFWFHDLYSKIIIVAVANEVERRAKEIEVSGEAGLKSRWANDGWRE